MARKAVADLVVLHPHFMPQYLHVVIERAIGYDPQNCNGNPRTALASDKGEAPIAVAPPRAFGVDSAAQ